MVPTVHKANDPHVVHETIDGEVVIVNMENGTYYSTHSVGTTIWQMLVGGQTADAIIERLCRAYSQPRGLIERDVEFMVGMLLSEGLIVADGSNGVAAGADADEEALPAEYATPEISKYIDMQNMLLLDPIHEVDEQAGWPNPKQ